jgi:hypothetical protein
MSQDEYTILFWGSRRMVFTELGKITLIFDKELFFTKTRQELQRVMSEAEVGSHMTAFTFQLRTEELHRHNVQKFERVSRLMFKKIERGEIDINIKTGYAYDGPKDVNEVLEDCLAAVSLNSDCVWTTGKPLMNDDSNLAVTVQQIRPLSWIKRKLNIRTYAKEMLEI